MKNKISILTRDLAKTFEMPEVVIVKIEKLENIIAQKDEQLKEANAVIDGVSNYYDLYSDAWSGQEYEFLRLAEEYKEKWGL